MRCIIILSLLCCLTVFANWVPTVKTKKLLTSQFGSACSIINNGEVECWHTRYVSPGFNVPADLKDVVELTGHKHAMCALTSKGQIRCFTHTAPWNVPPPPKEVVAWKSVAPSFNFSCGIDVEGKLHCWGKVPKFSETSQLPHSQSKMTHVEVSNDRICAANENSVVYCWGKTVEENAHEIAFSTSIRQLVMTDYNVCVLTENGFTKCKLIYNYSQIHSEPLPPLNHVPFSKLAIGNKLGCGIDFSGKNHCWGEYKEIADHKAEIEGKLVDISTGDASVCAVGENGERECWGTQNWLQMPKNLRKVKDLYNSYHYICGIGENLAVHCRAGNGSSLEKSLPEEGMENVKKLAIAMESGCAILTDGQVKCWNDNEVPAIISPVVDLVAGHGHLCALTEEGKIQCWGSNTSGQTEPPSLKNVKALAAGLDHVCAIHTDGRVKCWGRNHYQQLDVPLNLRSAVKISSMSYTTCALLENKTVRCWGGDPYLQKPPSNLGKVIDVGVGSSHACALRENGTVRCWCVGGEFHAGDEGGQATVPKNLPKMKKLSVGAFRSCAIDMENRTYCWGN